MKIKESFHPYAAVTILLWALAYVFTRLALRHFSALPLGFLRYLSASAVLIPVAVANRLKPPARSDWPWFAASGAAGFSLYMVLFNMGTSYVSAATSSVMISTAPVFTALLAFVFQGEKLRWYQWFAIAIEFSGIVILTLYGGVFTLNKGVLLLVSAAVLFSVYNLLQRMISRRYTALQTTIYSILAGTLFLSVFAPASVKELKAAPSGVILILLSLGVFSSAVAYITWAIASQKAEKISQVSNYMFFTPFLTSVLGFFLAGEVPERPTLAGGGIIILGALLFNKHNLIKARKTHESK